MMLAKAGLGLRFNEHMEGDGPTVFAHACKMGLEGIVSKRKDSAYRSGRSRHWVKSKNSKHPAVKREAEEERQLDRGCLVRSRHNGGQKAQDITEKLPIHRSSSRTKSG